MGPIKVSSPFQGAMLRLDVDIDNIVFPYIVEWEAAEYDTKSFFDPYLPTQLTIPPGVSKVRLYAGIEMMAESATAHSTLINFRKNDGEFQGNPASNVRQGIDGWGKNIYSLVSPPIAVAAGDVFELRINNSAEALAINKVLSSPGSYMAIEAVEFTVV